MGITSKKDFDAAKYSFSFIDDNTLKEQLNWGKRILKEAGVKSMTKINEFVLYQKEIHYYTKNVSATGQYQNRMCIILETSNIYQGMVLICPIYSVNDETVKKEGLNIGRLFNCGDQSEFLAVITEIRFISKERFFYDKLGQRVIGNITNSVLIDIINLYISIIKKVIELPIVATKVETC